MLRMMRGPDGTVGLIPKIIAVLVVAGLVGITAPLILGPILSWFLEVL